MPFYPTARDLMEKLGHCSGCGETDPEQDDGYTECCTKRYCTGADPAVAQGPCCGAVAERLEREAAEGGPPARTVEARPAPAPVKKAGRARRTRSTGNGETQELHSASVEANLVSHPGGEAPTPPDTQEPAMTTPPAKESQATKHVFRNLMKDAENTFEPVGFSFSKDRAEYEAQAKAYLGDRSNLSGATIDGADWDAIHAHFIANEADAAPAEKPAPAPAAAAAAPAPGTDGRARRAAQGDASAPGWELLYDKPKHGCEVGRRWEGGKPAYALICKEHGSVHALPTLTSERAVRNAGGWCPECSA